MDLKNNKIYTFNLFRAQKYPYNFLACHFWISGSVLGILKISKNVKFGQLFYGKKLYGYNILTWRLGQIFKQ